MNRDGSVTSVSYDTEDRLLSYGDLRFTYTDHGDLLEKENVVTGQKITLTYDQRGQLTRAALSGGRAITYSIDGEGHRFTRSVDGVFQTGYMHDTSGRLIAEVEPSGQLRSHFVYATESHSPDYMIKSNEKFFFAKDQLGSIRAVINADTGAVAQAIHYDEFGRVLADTNPGFQPFGFAGGHYDHETGLVRFGARDYDPETGRWTARDPILFDGGDTNLFGYVNNDPVNFRDPSGLAAIGAPAVFPIDLDGGGGAGSIGAGIGGIGAIGGVCDIVLQSRQKGERNQTAKPDGTSNPYKHMKPNPDNPNEIKGKDPHTGKTVKRPMTDEFKRWWNSKHPDQKIP